MKTLQLKNIQNVYYPSINQKLYNAQFKNERAHLTKDLINIQTVKIQRSYLFFYTFQFL